MLSSNWKLERAYVCMCPCLVSVCVVVDGWGLDGGDDCRLWCGVVGGVWWCVVGVWWCVVVGEWCG